MTRDQFFLCLPVVVVVCLLVAVVTGSLVGS